MRVIGRIIIAATAAGTMFFAAPLANADVNANIDGLGNRAQAASLDSPIGDLLGGVLGGVGGVLEGVLGGLLGD